MSPGVVPADVAKLVAADAASLTDDGTLSLPDQDGTLARLTLLEYCFRLILLGYRSQQTLLGRCPCLTLCGRCPRLPLTLLALLAMMGRCPCLTLLGRCPYLSLLGRCPGLNLFLLAMMALMADFADLITVCVADVAVVGAAPLVVTDVFWFDPLLHIQYIDWSRKQPTHVHNTHNMHGLGIY